VKLTFVALMKDSVGGITQGMGVTPALGDE
jgi:hypothetical protein